MGVRLVSVGGALRYPCHPRPRRLTNISAFSFIAFAVLLILYFVLLRIGPRADTPDGLLILATGQKIIVYASILSIVFQALGALRVNSRAESAFAIPSVSLQ